MDLVRLISEMTNEHIDNKELFLVDVKVKGKHGNQKVQVFIDGDRSVDVDDCSRISRKLSEELEAQNLIEGRYVIEVSSPGADQPLKYIRQFPKHIGRELEVHTKDHKSYQGTLLNVIDNKIELSIKSGKVKKELNSETLNVSFEEINNARVVIRV